MSARVAVAADPNRWLALPVLLCGAFLPIFDFNVVNLALPSIRQELGATSAEVQLVVSAYAATYAVFLITGGRLGDLFGRKRMFTLGVAGFTLASMACGFAKTPVMLIASRILQGLTATAMAPQVLASIRVLFPASEQGRALSLYSATFGLANVLGQVCGGMLVSARPLGFTWQSIFLINIPVGIVALLGSGMFLRDTKARDPQKLDLAGVALLSLSLALLVYPLIEGREHGWPWWAAAMLAAVAPALALFAWYERRLAARGGSPLVDIAMLRQDGLATGIAIALLYYMLSAFYLMFSIYLQGGLKLEPADAGLRTVPFGIGYALAATVSARLMERLGSRALLLGLVVQIAGFAALALAVEGHRVVWMPAPLLIAGLGFGIVMPSIINAVIGSLDARFAGLASGVLISTFQIGAALGVAVVGGVFFQVLGPSADLASHAHAFVIGLSCNVALLGIAALLSLKLRAP
jgi:EmrB/QacA subfamily drug resistance transporter